MNDPLKAFEEYLETTQAPPDVLELYECMEAAIHTYVERREELAFMAGFKAGGAGNDD